MPNHKYQFFNRLRSEEYAALETDIAKRGVLVAVEKDENGNILDGHHRVEIADRLGKRYKTIVRKFKSEAEKKQHVIKINLARRHLDSIQWGLAFAKLLEIRGVSRGRGARNDRTNATLAQVASELGVPKRTVCHRLALADAFESLPKREAALVGSGVKINSPGGQRRHCCCTRRSSNASRDTGNYPK